MHASRRASASRRVPHVYGDLAPSPEGMGLFGEYEILSVPCITRTLNSNSFVVTNH